MIAVHWPMLAISLTLATISSLLVFGGLRAWHRLIGDDDVSVSDSLLGVFTGTFLVSLVIALGLAYQSVFTW